jgi:hypothetical protein
MMRGAGRFHTRSKRPATPRGECDGRLLCSGPARHAHALVSQGDARTSARTPARHANALVSQGHARTTVRARVRTSRACAAAAASTRQVVLGHQPVRQQNNTKGSRKPAPRAPMGSPPAADTRPGVRQQMRAVRGAGAALPRCPGPRSADLKRAPSNFSKSGRDERRGAAAQHKNYGAVHRDTGHTRADPASSGPPAACSARSRAPHALSSRSCAQFSCTRNHGANSREFSQVKEHLTRCSLTRI